MEEPLTDSNKERRPMNDKNEYYAHQDSYAGRLWSKCTDDWLILLILPVFKGALPRATGNIYR